VEAARKIRRLLSVPLCGKVRYRKTRNAAPAELIQPSKIAEKKFSVPVDRQFPAAFLTEFW
jgi:hypothetical protein